METPEFVIRSMMEKDTSQIMKIWLHSNIEAHDFIPADYWNNQTEYVEKALLQAEVYVYGDGSRILGFAGLTGDYLAGIFVRSDLRSKGIGRLLLEHLKSGRRCLTLHVYKENAAALRFYKKNGFQISAEDIDEMTGEREYEMIWKSE